MNKIRSPKIGNKVAPARKKDSSRRKPATNAFEGSPPFGEASPGKTPRSSGNARKMSGGSDVSRSVPVPWGRCDEPPRLRPRALSGALCMSPALAGEVCAPMRAGTAA